MPRYIIASRSCLLEGTIIFDKPSPNDLLVSELEPEMHHVIKDGVQRVKILNTLVEKHDCKLVILSKSKENEQIAEIEALKEACQKNGIKFPKILAIAVCDRNSFQDTRSADPMKIKDRSHGVWIAGYGKEERNKACARNALSKLLDISEGDRKNHIVIEDIPQIQEAAEKEGWKTYLVGKDMTILGVLEQIEKIVPRSTSIGKPSSYGSQSSKNSSLKSLNPNKKSEIIRCDCFESLNKAVGSNFLFKHTLANKEWLGRQTADSMKEGEPIARRQKISSEFYERYEVIIPNVETALLKFPMGKSKTSCIMKEIMPEVRSYDQVFKREFDIKHPIPEGCKEEVIGYGRMLAVAALINDVEAIGSNGENIGFVMSPDKKTITVAKTDFVGGFTKDISPKKRSIQVAKGMYLEFDKLPLYVREEFQECLETIKNDGVKNIKEFFDRGNPSNMSKYLKDFGSNPDEITNWVWERLEELLKEYGGSNNNGLKQIDSEIIDWIPGANEDDV